MEQTIRTGLAHKVDAAGYDPDLVLQTDDTGKVIAGKVQTEHFADGSVTREKIADGALTNVAFSMNASDLIDMTKLHLPDIPPKNTGRYVFMYNVDADAFAFEPIPESYTFLEYLESTGTQYIDTGISAPNGFVIDTTLLSAGIGGCAVGAHNDFAPWGRNYLGFNANNSDKLFNFGAGGHASFSVDITQKMHIQASTKIKDVWLKINGISQNVSLTDASPDTRSANSLYLFDIHGGNITREWSGRIYHCNITANSTSIDLTPARRDSDGTLGMYDVANKKFYTNAGTGTFIAGPDL